MKNNSKPDSPQFQQIINILKNSAVLYTALTLLFVIVFMIINNNEDKTAAVSALQVLLFYPFCFLFTAANSFLRRSEMKKAARIIIHYLLTMASFSLFLYLPVMENKEAKNLIVVIFVLTVVYCVLMAAYLIWEAKSASRKKTQTEYQSMFKKN